MMLSTGSKEIIESASTAADRESVSSPKCLHPPEVLAHASRTRPGSWGSAARSRLPLGVRYGSSVVCGRPSVDRVTVSVKRASRPVRVVANNRSPWRLGVTAVRMASPWMSGRYADGGARLPARIRREYGDLQALNPAWGPP